MRARAVTTALFAFGVPWAMAVAAPPAFADDAVCVASSEKALSLRSAGKLRDALKELAICADPACPSEVREECSRRIDQVRDAQPTLILAARDGAGNDLFHVTVSVDGAPLGAALDGRAVVIDPGAHRFTFETPGQPSVDRTLVLREGDKDRRESVVLGPPAPPVVPVTPTSTWNARKTLAVVSAGVGVAGVALGAVWGTSAISSQNSENGDCSKSVCPRPTQALSEYNSARQDATLSTVTLLAGGALVVAGAVLWLTAPSGRERETAASSYRLGVVPVLAAGTGALLLDGRF